MTKLTSNDRPYGPSCAPLEDTRDSCCMLHSFNRAQPCNSETRLPPAPTVLPVGAILECDFQGETVVAVGTAPSGFVALLSRRSWQLLQSFKLDRLSASSQGVRAWSSQSTGASRPLVARFITGAALSDTVRFRNGNLFDLRRSNLAVVPRSLIAAARRPVSDETGDVQLRDGRWRAPRKQKMPSARRRLEAILADPLISAAY